MMTKHCLEACNASSLSICFAWYIVFCEASSHLCRVGPCFNSKSVLLFFLYSSVAFVGSTGRFGLLDMVPRLFMSSLGATWLS